MKFPLAMLVGLNNLKEKPVQEESDSLILQFHDIEEFDGDQYNGCMT